MFFFLNAAKLEEVFWLEKENGYTAIKRAVDDKQIAAYMSAGDQIGYLWKQGLYGSMSPNGWRNRKNYVQPGQQSAAQVFAACPAGTSYHMPEHSDSIYPDNAFRTE